MSKFLRSAYFIIPTLIIFIGATINLIRFSWLGILGVLGISIVFGLLVGSILWYIFSKKKG